MSAKKSEGLKDIIEKINDQRDLCFQQTALPGVTEVIRELDIAMNGFLRPQMPDSTQSYISGCYSAAAATYIGLLEDTYNQNIDIDNVILMMTFLANGLPLTPIDLDSAYWVDVTDSTVWPRNGTRAYQASRYKHLYKYELIDGRVKFSDFGGHTCIDDQNPSYYFSPGTIQPIMDELYPIEFPYMPSIKKREVHCIHAGSAIHILYIIEPDGAKTKVNKCYMRLPFGEIKKISKTKFLSEQIKDKECVK